MVGVHIGAVVPLRPPLMYVPLSSAQLLVNVHPQVLSTMSTTAPFNVDRRLWVPPLPVIHNDLLGPHINHI